MAVEVGGSPIGVVMVVFWDPLAILPAVILLGQEGEARAAGTNGLPGPARGGRCVANESDNDVADE